MQYLANNDDGFPAALRHIDPPAKGIYLQGSLPNRPLVAVVGARRCDDYGLRVASKLGQELAEAGVGVVSGGAAGVDTAALSSCLAASGKPVCVLGTGLDIAYPTANRTLFQRIAQQGALMSEYAPGTPGIRRNFPHRNRLVAALAVGVVVVRATLGSGSLITARLAVRQKRPLMAVPGPVDAPLSAGVHSLIKQGAHLVENVDDVLGLLELSATKQAELAFPKTVEPRPNQKPAAVSLPPMSQQEQAIFDSLGTQACPIDVIGQQSGLPSSEVSAILLQMELKGWVSQHPGMQYKRII